MTLAVLSGKLKQQAGRPANQFPLQNQRMPVVLNVKTSWAALSMIIIELLLLLLWCPN